MRERNKPRQKEEKVLIIEIKKSLFKFNFSNLLRTLNLAFAPKMAPKETKITRSKSSNT